MGKCEPFKNSQSPLTLRRIRRRPHVAPKRGRLHCGYYCGVIAHVDLASARSRVEGFSAMCSFKHIFVAFLLFSLVACSGTAPRDLKPWEKSSHSGTGQDSSANNRSTRPNYGPKLAVGKPYTVKRGDTLYAIAFRLGLDFRELAARNGIKAPYTINVGQVLQTSKPAAVASNKSSKTSGSGKSTTTRATSSKTKARWLNQSRPLGRRLNRHPRRLK